MIRFKDTGFEWISPKVIVAVMCLHVPSINKDTVVSIPINDFINNHFEFAKTPCDLDCCSYGISY